MTEQKDLKINEAGVTLTDNEIIAQFMGLPLTKKSKSFVSTRHDIEIPFMRWRYDKEWNWLIDVVEKIESNPINDVCIFKEATQIRVWSGDKEMFIWKVVEPDANSKIAHVFRAVVKYIKWYNETQSGRG